MFLRYSFTAEVVEVQGMSAIRAALATRPRAVLLSPPGFALAAGAGFWRALVAAAEAEFPGRIEADLLDCADAPGAALGALRAGCRHIVLDPASPGFSAVAAAAHAAGATLLPARPTRDIPPPLR